VRELRGEAEQKGAALEKLRRDVKLSRQAEIEAEIQTYIDEC
jgi:hypothetical protein